jgi:type II secretory pathway pseudopilin PulG
MKRLLLIISTILALAAFSSAPAQSNRSAELDKAYEEARAAYLALQEAQKRRDEGLEPLPGERQGTAGGGASRPNEAYLGRQAQLEYEFELARRRYEAAAKRWNDLK